ncbi:hypothetical protein HMPREF0578_0451 [Mobiluncus mulieris 28-1]|nr:hypothetical protein HMPREF0578_0451 [Mobiluncus mulieris 28-1]
MPSRQCRWVLRFHGFPSVFSSMFFCEFTSFWRLAPHEAVS